MKRTSYNLPNHAHYLTFSCYRRQQLLVNDPLCQMLLETWGEAKKKAEISIWAYVIMPEHVHLLVYPRNESYDMSSILRYLKAPFTRRAVVFWQRESPTLLRRVRIQRGKRVVHRFWQEGGAYDRNLYDWGAIRRAIEYIEWNPVRRGLVSDPIDWKWSSARTRPGKSDGLKLVDISEFT